MDIKLANPRGFCAGVDRAIDIVDRALDIFGGSGVSLDKCVQWNKKAQQSN